MIVASHALRELEDLIDRVILLEAGRIIAEDDVVDLSKQHISGIEGYFDRMRKDYYNDKL